MLDNALSALAAAPFAQALKNSHYAYPLVNGFHIMSIGALFGSILSLDLRLMGFFPHMPLARLARYLPKIAGTALGMALVTGFLLFSVEPLDYANNRTFRLKLLIVGAGVIHAGLVHLSPAWKRMVKGARGLTPSLRFSGMLSLCIWTMAILAGRFIAF